jgi:hypothetical protein
MSYLTDVATYPGSRRTPETAMIGDDAPAQLRLTTPKCGAFWGLRLAGFRELAK